MNNEVRLFMLGALLVMSTVLTTIAFMPKCKEDKELKEALLNIVSANDDSKRQLTTKWIESIDRNDKTADAHLKAAQLFKDKIESLPECKR